MKIKESDKKAILLKMMETLEIEGQIIFQNGFILNKQIYGGYVITSDSATETEGTSVAYGLDRNALFNDLLNDWDAYLKGETK